MVVPANAAAAASRVAAGMLAPSPRSASPSRLCCRSTWPRCGAIRGFAAEVEEASGLPAGLRRTPTLSVAYDADDLARLRALSRLPGPARASRASG